MKTLMITGRKVKEVLTPAVAIDTVERAFRAYSLGEADMPPKSYLNFPKGDLRSMPAYLHGQGFDMAGIKSVNVHLGNAKLGLPTVMALIVLVDPGTGFPLAVLDGTLLTSLRTGAAGAVAARHLSRKDAKTVGFIGCGVQARTQLACLREVRKLERIRVWKFRPDDLLAPRFSRWVRRTFGMDVDVSEDIDAVTEGVDIVVTTTPSREPLVRRVSPGTHINAIGADAAGKEEIHPAVLKSARIVVDDWVQASHSGEINVPLAKGEITEKNIHGTLGDIITGRKKGRTSGKEITLFDSTGLAVQDVSCAEVVFRKAAKQKGVRAIRFF
jgi:alanine dehydrogenase